VFHDNLLRNDSAPCSWLGGWLVSKLVIVLVGVEYILNTLAYLYVPLPCAAYCFIFASIAAFSHVHNREKLYTFPYRIYRSDLAGYVVKQNLNTCRKSLAVAPHH
jgi:hypothetical protein